MDIRILAWDDIEALAWDDIQVLAWDRQKNVLNVLT